MTRKRYIHHWSKRRGTATCFKCGGTRTEHRGEIPRYLYKDAAGKAIGGIASLCKPNSTALA